MALGAVAAVEAAGLTGKVTVAGFDGSPDAVQAIKDGKLLATGLQPAVQIAEMAVEQADELITTGEATQPEKQSDRLRAHQRRTTPTSLHPLRPRELRPDPTRAPPAGRSCRPAGAAARTASQRFGDD